ncbi:M4 family metallopeptidase [Amycolatopsis sp. RTGN1]|uniref:M4 family metallopeptidase n=1 Tax=Amycolatopsis ponsaeliensis TaxID=2992142 RepID=UPI0025506EB1|nr:M4 family metallopeptidase [Amycolatopsis sp. RTGN1]
MRSPRGLTAIAGLALTFAVPVIPAIAAPENPAATPPEALAARAADQAALAGADRLAKGAGEAFVRTGVTPGGGGLYYASYQRTYHGLPVVVADGAGRVRGTEAAHTAPIAVPTQATLKADQATKIATAKVSTVDSTTTPKLVVLAGDAPKLAYEVVVSGHDKNKPAKLHVFVDSATGAVLDTRDDVREAGTGNSYYAGTVSIDTSGSGSSYSMTDPARRGIACGREGGAIFTKSSNTWGTSSGTDLETGCVDTLYSVQTEWKMLGEWLGRSGIDGAGGGFRASVGLNDVNAYWDGSSTHFGHSQDNRRQATPMDVVGHEFGHAVFQTTPGGAGSGNENGGLNESTGDIFGALTEAYANNPVDRPDFTVGEGVNLVGQGPIRYMYNPSQVGDPNCYSASIPSTEVHAAAGPQNHWFYLLSQGSNASPASPTCNGSTVTGIGIQKAGKIFYNGLLKKTSSWNHKAARKATLEAAIALFPGSCTEYNATKAAWDAVSVTAVSGEPACSGQPPAGNDYSLTLSPSSASVQPGQTATTTVSTQITSGNAQAVQLLATGLPEGAKATFSPATVQSGGTSTLTITTSATTPQGTSQVTVTGDGTDADHTAQFSLTVGTGTPPTGCDGLAEWDSAKAYVPNDVVGHNGHKWTSLWYSTGAEPGAPTSWAVWSDGGAC